MGTTQIIIDNHKYSIDDENIIDSGQEADICKISEDYVAKVYSDKAMKMTYDNGLERRNKLMALISSFKEHNSLFKNVAFPQTVVHKGCSEFDCIYGFSMFYFKDCPPMIKMRYNGTKRDFNDYKGHKLDDKKAIDFLYNISHTVHRLHHESGSGIIIADVNEKNILYDIHSNLPIIVDIDSAQIGLMKSFTESPENLDPSIEKEPRDIHGRHTYSMQSDIFALACVYYKFLIGNDPFYIDAYQEITQEQAIGKDNKKNGFCILKFLTEKKMILNGIHLSEDSEKNKLEIERLNIIKGKYPKIYDYFVSIFVNGNRISLLRTLEPSDPRHPSYAIIKAMSIYNRIKSKSKPTVSPTHADMRKEITIAICADDEEELVSRPSKTLQPTQINTVTIATCEEETKETTSQQRKEAKGLPLKSRDDITRALCGEDQEETRQQPIKAVTDISHLLTNLRAAIIQAICGGDEEELMSRSSKSVQHAPVDTRKAIIQAICGDEKEELTYSPIRPVKNAPVDTRKAITNDTINKKNKQTLGHNVSTTHDNISTTHNRDSKDPEDLLTFLESYGSVVPTLSGS